MRNKRVVESRRGTSVTIEVGLESASIDVDLPLANADGAPNVEPAPKEGAPPMGNLYFSIIVSK